VRYDPYMGRTTHIWVVRRQTVNRSRPITWPRLNILTKDLNMLWTVRLLNEDQKQN